MVVHRRGPWSQHEDQWLVNLVVRNGPHNWVRISQEIATRSPKQCRERYHQNLKPSLNHNPITPEEGELIERLVGEMGKRWAEIARRLNGRSDNAVKNWWNGGQNRRKRNHDRHDHRGHQQTPPSAYHYAHRVEEIPHPSQHPLPRLSNEYPESASQYYPQSRRTSLNPPMASPHGVKLPQLPPFQHGHASRPQPLDLPPYAVYPGPRGPVETPIPSPGYSIVSIDTTPSMITDTGSESRSPRGAPSPIDQPIGLPPLVGARSERKNSRTRFLPQSGFALDDDHHQTSPYDHRYRRRASVQLPPLHHGSEPAPPAAPSAVPAPAFREPDYKLDSRGERPSLLTQPTHHALPHPNSPVQHRLPAYEGLTLPSLQAIPASQMSPSSRHLPRPTSTSRSAPTSPRNNNQDTRMKLSNIL